MKFGMMLKRWWVGVCGRGGQVDNVPRATMDRLLKTGILFSVLMLIIAGTVQPASAVRCNSSEAAVKCTEYKPYYYPGTNESRINFPLAELSGNVANESYSNNASEYSKHLADAGFENVKLLQSNQATPIDPLSLAGIVNNSMDGSSQTDTQKIAQMVNLARNSLRVVVGVQHDAYIDGIKRRIVAISFRGTETSGMDQVYDLALDVSAGTIPFSYADPNNLVHEGFKRCAKVMETELEATYIDGASSLKDIIDNAATSGDIIWISGHSLGGAVATIYAALLIDRGVPRDNLVVYTFGAPSAGNSHFKNVFFNEEASPTPAQLAKKINMHRIRNKFDFIPYSAYFQFVSTYALEAIAVGKISAAALKLLPGPVVALADTYVAVALLKDILLEFSIRTYFSSWPYEHIGYPLVVSNFQDVTSQFVEGTVSTADRIALANEIYNPPQKSFSHHDMKMYIANIKSLGVGAPRGDVTLPKVKPVPDICDNCYYTIPIQLWLRPDDTLATIYVSFDPAIDPQKTDVVCTDLSVTSKAMCKYTAWVTMFTDTTFKVIAVDRAGNSSAPQSYSYKVRPIQAISPYLEIQASSDVHVFSFGATSLSLKPTDNVRLYMRNDPNLPDFRAFTGVLTVGLIDAKDKFYKVPGRLLADGGVEFNIDSTMSVNTYFTVLHVLSIDGEVKQVAGHFNAQQLVEFDTATGGGGTGGGTITIPRTGQTTSYVAGDDGALQAGKAWPVPRFTDNANGTVTDNLTGLIWLKNANCTDTAGGISKSGGTLTWANALTWSSSLASGACGLSDGSTAGQWRLPNLKELQSLVSRQQAYPATWLNTQGFSIVQSNFYWSSSTGAGSTGYAWVVGMGNGYVDYNGDRSYIYYVWPVRGGQ